MHIYCMAGGNKTASPCTFTTVRLTLYEIINKTNLREPREYARCFTAKQYAYTHTDSHTLMHAEGESQES